MLPCIAIAPPSSPHTDMPNKSRTSWFCHEH
uniref:Uncharacterized protein n=1 Tax=Arundo donax TaxID=35708 RepID=A0A0A8YVL7_ARUDO